MARHAAKGAEEQRRAAKRQIRAAGAVDTRRHAFAARSRCRAARRPPCGPAAGPPTALLCSGARLRWLTAAVCTASLTRPTARGRGFLGDTDCPTFVTDARSQKAWLWRRASELRVVLTSLHEQVTEVAQSPFAEACWYLPQTREQFRLSGARCRTLARRPPADRRRRRPAANSRPAVRRRRVA